MAATDGEEVGASAVVCGARKRAEESDTGVPVCVASSCAHNSADEDDEGGGEEDVADGYWLEKMKNADPRKLSARPVRLRGVAL